MHTLRRRSGVIALATAIVATALLATTSFAGFPSYRHCDLYNSSGDHLTAYCDRKAAGTEYRVVIDCQNGRTYFGPWRRQSGTYSSTKYCPEGINLRDGHRQLR